MVFTKCSRQNQELEVGNENTWYHQYPIDMVLVGTRSVTAMIFNIQSSIRLATILLTWNCHQIQHMACALRIAESAILHGEHFQVKSQRGNPHSKRHQYVSTIYLRIKSERVFENTVFKYRQQRPCLNSLNARAYFFRDFLSYLSYRSRAKSISHLLHSKMSWGSDHFQ